MPRDVTGVACGLRHSLAVCSDGSLYGCGSNKKGQLGLEDKKDYLEWRRLDACPDKAKEVVAGQHYSLVKTESGDWYGFGDNRYEQLGPLTLTEICKDSTLMTSLSGVDKVSCGWTHMVALAPSKAVLGWGRKEYGQLAGNDLLVDKISAGSEHCLATRSSDGNLVGTNTATAAWGQQEKI